MEIKCKLDKSKIFVYFCGEIDENSREYALVLFKPKRKEQNRGKENEIDGRMITVKLQAYPSIMPYLLLIRSSFSSMDSESSHKNSAVAMPCIQSIGKPEIK